MPTSSVRLTNRFTQSKAQVRDYLGRTICATGKQIAEQTRGNMVPGHFLDSGLSQENTQYEQLGALNGQVHVATDYAGDAEFGTVNMAPRPVLRPAIMQVWPDGLRRNWERADSLPRADAPGPPGPVVRKP